MGTKTAEIKEKHETPENMNKWARLKKLNKMKDDDKFSKVLDSCRGILSSTIYDGGDIYELLDPLISDTQCHMHCVLMLNTLYKLYDGNRFAYDRIEELEERDKEVLSYAVLFSLLKNVYRDKFGFSLREVSSRNFDGLLLSSKKAETYFVLEGKKKFNSYSVDHTRSVAGEEVKDILNECQAVTPKSHLKLLPCYASTSAVIDFIEREKLPIIISLTSFDRRVTDEGAKYKINSTHVDFHEFRSDEKDFFLKNDPSDSQKKQPTIIFRCYRIINNGTQEFPIDYKVKDLLKLCAASHIQLPESSQLPAGYEDCENYVKYLYGKNADIRDEYDRCLGLAEKYNLIDARYERIVQTSTNQEAQNITIAIERRSKDTFFSVDHVLLSNYSRECRRFKNLDFNTELYQTEVFEFKKKEVNFEAWKIGRKSISS